jgi:predicted aconitase with swiveling domain
VLAEAIRAGTAPAAIVLLEADPIVALGAIVARELYGVSVPVVVTSGIAPANGIRLRVRATADGARVEPA